MIWTSGCLLFIFLFLQHIVFSISTDSLLLTSVLFRHGDRSPVSTYPNDPYTEDEWPQGYGQLSKEGIAQEYKLGEYFRERYKNFLNATYSRYEIYMQSTEYERTMMSAQSVLAGLYPIAEDKRWDPGYPWQPIPVHVKSNATGFKIHNLCPRLDQLWNETRSTPEVQQVLEKYKSLFANLTRNSGYDSSAGFRPLHVVRDNLFCRIRHNKTLPDWYRDDLFQQMTDAVTDLLISPTENSEINKLRDGGGSLVAEILRNMEERANGTLDPRMKAYFYSAHDSTVIALLGALRVFNHRIVPYSTAVLVELHQIQDVGPVVQIWLKNGTDETHQLTLPGCDQNCPLSDFKRLTKDVIPTWYSHECQIYTSTLEDLFSQATLAVFISVVVGVILFVFVVIPAAVFTREKWKQSVPRLYGKLRAEVMIPEQVPMIETTELSDIE